MSSEQLDIATNVADLVRAAAPHAEAEVLVERDALALTRFANSTIHQNVAEATTTIRLTVHVDGRTAAGSTTLTGTGALADLVARTLAAARLCPIDIGWPGLAPVAPLLTSGSVDDAIVAASPSERAARVRAFVDATGGLTAAGYCRTRYISAAFTNSIGQAIIGGTTEIAMDGIARTATSDGTARMAASRMADVDGAILGARAAAKARAAADPVELPPGQYEVVLEQTAVSDLLQSFAMFGFDGKAVNERRSFLDINAAQFDPAISMYDDAVSPGTIGLPFDAQGTPKRRVDLVEAGVTKAATHDRRTAVEGHTQSTGHARSDAEGPVGAGPANLTLQPGPTRPPGHDPRPEGDPRSGNNLPPGREPRPGSNNDGLVTEVDGPAADSTVAELVSRVSLGILVTDHWYTRVLDPRTLVMTGLTRNGVWLIEDGHPTRALRNFRFTQSYPQALAPGAVLGVGSAAIALPNSWVKVSFRAPALHLRSWNFTGGASG